MFCLQQLNHTGVIARDCGRPSNHRAAIWAQHELHRWHRVTGSPAFAGNDIVE
jgi:hypothetical protein